MRLPNPIHWGLNNFMLRLSQALQNPPSTDQACKHRISRSGFTPGHLHKPEHLKRLLEWCPKYKLPRSVWECPTLLHVFLGSHTHTIHNPVKSRPWFKRMCSRLYLVFLKQNWLEHHRSVGLNKQFGIIDAAYPTLHNKEPFFFLFQIFIGILT